jgi:hypothetical protein
VSEGAQDVRPSFGVARFAEETRERFVREIVARVPLPRLVELHLFAPMRQGGMESGVAVLAAVLELPEDEPPVLVGSTQPTTREPTGDRTPPADHALVVEPAREVVLADADADEGLAPERCDPTVAAAGPPPTAADAEAVDAPLAEPAADPDDTVDLAELVAEAPGTPPAPAAPAAPPRRHRHTVFTARYRLVLKGPERGRWDVEVREEADAPLITVEAVVRGVQARAGDAGDPERLDGAMVARILGVVGDAG